jgi:hypothetical protein
MSFFLFLTLMIVVQVAAATYTMAQANGAARAAARAATLHQGATQAARAAVSDSLREDLVAAGGATGDGQHWTVTLRVPKVLPRMPDWTVTREASMPATEPLGG